MAISHIKSNIVADFTGTVTVFNSAGSTVTVNATDLVRPSDWNSAHNQFLTIAGNTAGASTLSGSNIVLQGGNNLTLSANGQTLVLSAGASQTVQTQGMVSIQGSTGAIEFANNAAVTFGFNASTITATHNGITTGRASNDAIGLNTAQTNVTWTVNSAGLSFNAGGYAGTGFTSTTTAGTAVVATHNTAGLSAGFPAFITTAALSNHSHGNPTLNLTNLSGTTASNSAGLTLSLSAAAPSAASLTGNAVGNTTQGTSGTFTALTVTAAGGISAGWTNNSLVVSGPALTSLSVTGALSASSNGSTISLGVGTVTANAASNTTQQSTGTIDLGNLTFQGRGGVSVGVSGGSVVISGGAGAAQTGISGIIVSDATYTSGTVSFSNAGNITISSSVNGATQYIRLSGNAAQTNQSAIRGLGASNTGNTAGNTGISTGIDWVVAGSNNITISQSTVGGGPNTLWVSGPTVGGAQTGISGIVVSDTTYTSGTVSFSNAGNITISSSVNGATQFIRLSGNAAQTTQSAIRGFGVSNTGATAGNTGISTGIDWVLAGSQSLTLSQSTAGGGPNTIWIQHPAWITTARASTDAIGLNTAQTNVTWTVNSSGLSLNAAGYAGTGTTFNGANISGSITQNSVGLQLSMSVAAPGAAVESNAFNLLGANTAGNTTATGSTIGLSGLNLTLSGTNASQIVISAPATSSLVAAADISISTNGSTITISRTQSTQSGWNPYADLPTVADTLGNGTLRMEPLGYFPNVQYDRILLPIHNTNSSNSSGSHTLSFWFGLYSRNASTLSLASSTSISTALTHSGTAGSYSLYSGMRHFTIGSTNTINGGQWWMGFVSRTTSGGANGSYSNAMVSGLATAFVGFFGSAHNTTNQWTLGQGVYSATTSGLPNSIAFSELRGSDSVLARAPYFILASSTV